RKLRSSRFARRWASMPMRVQTSAQRFSGSGSKAIGPSSVKRSNAMPLWASLGVILAINALWLYGRFLTPMPNCSRKPERPPSAEPLINLSGAEGQRRGARVIARLIGVARRERFDQHDLPAAGLGPGLQGQRQTGANQTATNDCQIDSAHAACIRAAAISASISATVFGTPLVRI